MNKKKVTKMTKLKVFLLMLSILAIITISQALGLGTKESDYYSISLSGVDAYIPKGFYDSEKCIENSSDHMFFICEKNQEYIVYGIELNHLIKEDENTGLLSNHQNVCEILEASNEYEIMKGIQDTTGLLQNKVTYDTLIKPSYQVYSYEAKEIISEKEYNSFIIYYTFGKKKYMQVMLYQDSALLTDSNKKYIERFTY